MNVTLSELLISIVSTMHIWNEQTNQLFIYNFTSFFTVRCRQRRLSLFPLNIDPVWLAISNTQIVCSYGYALNSDHLLTFFLQKYQYRYISVVIKNSSYKRIFLGGFFEIQNSQKEFLINLSFANRKKIQDDIDIVQKIWKYSIYG